MTKNDKGEYRTLVAAGRDGRSTLRVAVGARAAGLVALALVLGAPPAASGAAASAKVRPPGSVTAGDRSVGRPARMTSPPSARKTAPVSRKPPRPDGAANLHKLANSLRRVITRLRWEKIGIACVTRDMMLRRLRITYGALVSGDRTAAADLLRVWIADARSKAAAGVLPEPQATGLRTELREILERVGSGRSTRLKHPPHLPLPRPLRCESSPPPPTGVATTALKVVSITFKLIKGGASTLRTLKKVLWPDQADGSNCTSTSCSGDSVYDLIASDKVAFASQTLDSLSRQLDDVFNAEDSGDTAAWARQWQIAEGFFVEEAEPVFQAAGYEIPLLPLYAQYENLRLSLLRYGILNGPKMSFTEEFIRTIEDKIVNELPTASDYTTATFAQAVHAAQHYDDNEKQYASKNPPWVDNRIQALDFRDMWGLQSPLAYPYGDPNFRQKRMIYSDEWGRTDSTFPEFGLDDSTGDLTNPPMPNVEYPLSHLTAWLKQEYSRAYNPPDYFNWLSAIKLDNAPVEGPLMGDTALTPEEFGEPPARFSYDVAPGATIAEVGATWSERDPLFYPQDLIQVLKLNFSDGRSEVPGGHFYSTSRTRYWSYPDEVLASARVFSRFKWGNNNYTADAIVFGFRFDDSFEPLSPPAFGRVTPQAPNDQMCMAIEQKTLQGSPDFPHNGEQTGKRYDVASNRGPEVQLYDCNYAGWNGTAPWETTWSFGNEGSDDPSKGELTVFGDTKCAAPDPADPSAVQIQDCDGTARQMWTPRADGSIVNAQSGRCLERSGLANGDPVRLNDCIYVATPSTRMPIPEQRWSWPAGWTTGTAGS